MEIAWETIKHCEVGELYLVYDSPGKFHFEKGTTLVACEERRMEDVDD